MSDEIRGAQWQLISVEPQTNTRRLRVQGGWIYRLGRRAVTAAPKPEAI